MRSNSIHKSESSKPRDWKTLIDRRVKEIGVANENTEESVSNWYRTKKITKGELFYDGSWQGHNAYIKVL